MRKITKILFVIVAFFTFSCEDFLDHPPKDKIAVDAFFTTSNDVENYVKKYYSNFPTHGSANLPKSENNSDNLIVTTPNSVINGTRSPQNGKWTGSWSNIRSVNILFDNLYKVKDPISSYSQYLGEAFFFRAWFYSSLYRAYGDLPIHKTQLFPGDEALMDVRRPRNEVADFILSDLDSAFHYLKTRAEVGNSRLNKETALAFSSRIALFEASWQKYHAGTEFGTAGVDPNKYFNKVISVSQELLSGNYTNGIYNTGDSLDYYNLFGMDDMSKVNEVYFQRIANSRENLGHNLQFYTTRRTADMSITWWLVTSYLGKDGQPYDYLDLSTTTKGNAFLSKIAEDCDPRLYATVWIPGDLRVASSGMKFDKPFLTGGSEELCATGFQVKKYSNPYSSGAGKDWGGYSETGYILFRHAEVILNYVEAQAELGQTVDVSLINLLRSRVKMPDFSVISQANYGSNLVDYGYVVSDEIYAIRNERRVELALEGHRASDYRRWAAHKLFQGKRPLGYPLESSEFQNYPHALSDDGLIDYFASSMPNGYGFKEGRDYLSSIPQDEITMNPDIKQNPGWEKEISEE
jgi:hypothetical protein